MKTHKHPLSAVQNWAGNQQSHDRQPLALQWLRFVGQPDNRKALESFSWALDLEIRARMPEKSLRGILRGREAEVRQDALLLLLGRLLSGNRRLMDLTADASLDMIEREIARSVSAGVKYAHHRLHRKAWRDAKWWRPLSDAEARPSLDGKPSNGQFVQNETLLKLAMRCLRRGVRNKRLSRRTASVGLAMLHRGWSQAEIARRTRKSRASVSQKMAAIRTYLRAEMESEIEDYFQGKR